MTEILKRQKTQNQISIDYFIEDLSRYYTGRATPMLLDGIKVPYYGEWVPLDHAASVSVRGHDALIVTPHDKSMTKDIERAIHKANLGLNPQADSEMVKVYLPKKTKESNQKIFKIIKDRAEIARIAIRYNRQKARNELLVEAVKPNFDLIPEDEQHRIDKEIQKCTDEFIEKINNILENKRIELKV